MGESPLKARRVVHIFGVFPLYVDVFLHGDVEAQLLRYESPMYSCKLTIGPSHHRRETPQVQVITVERWGREIYVVSVLVFALNGILQESDGGVQSRGSSLGFGFWSSVFSDFGLGPMHLDEGRV